jgi:hypothetical protein
MKNNKIIIAIILPVVLLFALVIGRSVFTPKDSTDTQTTTETSKSNPISDMIKGKGEPKLEIIADIDLARFDVNGKPMRDNEYLWAEKEYKEEGGKHIWTYTHRGIVGKLISSDKKDIDEFSYTFDIDLENSIQRQDVLSAIGYFDSSLEKVYKIDGLSDLTGKYTNLSSISANYDKDLIPKPETKFSLNGILKGEKQTWNCVFKYNKNSLIKQVAEQSGESFTDEKIKEASQETIQCVASK